LEKLIYIVFYIQLETFCLWRWFHLLTEVLDTCLHHHILILEDIMISLTGLSPPHLYLSQPGPLCPGILCVFNDLRREAFVHWWNC